MTDNQKNSTLLSKYKDVGFYIIQAIHINKQSNCLDYPSIEPINVIVISVTNAHVQNSGIGQKNALMHMNFISELLNESEKMEEKLDSINQTQKTCRKM